MDDRDLHIGHLRAAEAQFRLATAARVAVTFGHQPLDLPIQWSHGKHVVNYADVALSKEEADFAAWNLQRSASFLMASAAREAIKRTTENPKSHPNSEVRSAYQIARMIRNAFSHSPFNPIWKIDSDCSNRKFMLEGVIRLDCTNLDGKRFDWRDYGGPLALLGLSRYVRYNILGDSREPEKAIPIPEQVYYQQGDLIVKKVDDIPPGTLAGEEKYLDDYLNREGSNNSS